MNQSPSKVNPLSHLADDLTPEMLREHPEWTQKDIIVAVAKKWREMTPDQQKAYNDRAIAAGGAPPGIPKEPEDQENQGKTEKKGVLMTPTKANENDEQTEAHDAGQSLRHLTSTPPKVEKSPQSLQSESNDRIENTKPTAKSSLQEAMHQKRVFGGVKISGNNEASFKENDQRPSFKLGGLSIKSPANSKASNKEDDQTTRPKIGFFGTKPTGTSQVSNSIMKMEPSLKGGTQNIFPPKFSVVQEQGQIKLQTEIVPNVQKKTESKTDFDVTEKPESEEDKKEDKKKDKKKKDKKEKDKKEKDKKEKDKKEKDKKKDKKKKDKKKKGSDSSSSSSEDIKKDKKKHRHHHHHHHPHSHHQQLSPYFHPMLMGQMPMQQMVYMRRYMPPFCYMGGMPLNAIPQMYFPGGMPQMRISRHTHSKETSSSSSSTSTSSTSTSTSTSSSSSSED